MPLSSHRIEELPMLIDLKFDHSADLSAVGGKAHSLARLYAIGMPVPRAIVVPFSVDISDDSIRQSILAHELFTNDQQLYAVRSSGVGEDSEKNSYAGIFDTYLDVTTPEIFDRIASVRDSVVSKRSLEYSNQRGVQVASMSVIVQHMVPAEYAGVAFTMSPIEKDDRIALIEIVPGVGESLVSGKTTPTTLRYNKRTNLYRVQQQGANPIDDQVVARIVAKLTPLLTKIEEEYSFPVDVEWAYAEDEIFILQARPITT